MTVAIVVMVVVGLSIALVAGGASAKRMRATWERSATELGLSFEPGPHAGRYIHERKYMPEMFGQYDGQDIYVGVRAYSTGSGKNRQTHYYTYVDVVLDLSLKRALRVERADGVSKFFASIFGQLDVQVGKEQLDIEYRIKGQDPRQIAALINTPELSALLLAERTAFRPVLTDDYVRLEAPGIHVDHRLLQPLLGRTVAIARALVAAWRALPPSREEAQVEPVWRRVCERGHLAYQARGMRATGRRDDVMLRVELVLDYKRGWVTEIAAVFDPPLGVGMSVASEGVLSGLKKLFGAQDIVVGDETFDRTFVIKGKDPDVVKQMLTDDARARILELFGRVDELSIDDVDVIVRSHRIIDEEAELAELVQLVAGAGNDLVAHRRVMPLGPYR